MLSGTSCALVPSGKAVWLRIEEWNMHWPKLHFVFSGFLSTMLLTFLSFSLFLMQQTPRAIVVKCDGSVYDVDVDVEKNDNRNYFMINLQVCDQAGIELRIPGSAVRHALYQ